MDEPLSHNNRAVFAAVPVKHPVKTIPRRGLAEVQALNPGTQAERHAELHPGMIVRRVGGASVEAQGYAEVPRPPRARRPGGRGPGKPGPGAPSLSGTTLEVPRRFDEPFAEHESNATHFVRPVGLLLAPDPAPHPPARRVSAG